MRRLVVTTVGMVVVGFALPVVVWTAWWYLSVPRTWWSLAILLISAWLPAATAFAGIRRARRLRREIEAERVSQRLADHRT
jgi:uncharacterized membrane protein